MAGIRCPHCGSDQHRSFNTVNRAHLQDIRRRRHCLRCGGKFATVERIEGSEVLGQTVTVDRLRAMVRLNVQEAFRHMAKALDDADEPDTDREEDGEADELAEAVAALGN
jgi:transcriptional regulator NrdR family protein